MKNKRGFTLIEILVALLLGIIIVGATLAVYVSTIKGSSDTAKSARLNHDLETAMQFMINDIRRAGYWGDAVTGSNAANNPFTQGGANIAIGGTGNSCILYSYDGETTNGVADLNEYYGFKLEDNTIKIRTLVTGTTAANLACNAGTWTNILDSDNIEIMTLTFSAANSQCLNNSTALSSDNPYPSTCAAMATAGHLTTGQTAIENRRIDITLIGRVKSDTSVEKTLTGTVKVRNNRIFIQ